MFPITVMNVIILSLRERSGGVENKVGSGVSREVVLWKGLLLIFKQHGRVETAKGKSPVI